MTKIKQITWKEGDWDTPLLHCECQSIMSNDFNILQWMLFCSNNGRDKKWINMRNNKGRWKCTIKSKWSCLKCKMYRSRAYCLNIKQFNLIDLVCIEDFLFNVRRTLIIYIIWQGVCQDLIPIHLYSHWIHLQ